METTEEETNKAQFRRTYEEMFNQGNLAIADELIAPDCINHEVPPGMNNRGPESGRQVVMMLRTAFPDLHCTVDAQIAEGDQVLSHCTLSGTHLGPFVLLQLWSLPSTGKRFSVRQMHLHRLCDGQTVEHWAVREDLGMLQQLGIVSVPGQAIV